MLLQRSARLQLLLLFAAFSVQVQADDCQTPNNEQGRCISLYKCPVLLGVLANQTDESAAELVRKSNCGGTLLDPVVCCGSSANLTLSQTPPPPSDTTPKVDKESLLPSKTYCGYQHSDDYFHTMNGTAITEFPWLAWIRYNHKFTGVDKGYKCSGSLISDRYVLTVASCIVPTGYFSPPAAIRLGEYDVTNATDCTQDSDFYECSNPVEEIGIEKMIPHPEYETTYYNNNIGLIRLNRTVQYSEYIRPICLPVPGTKLAKVGDTLTSSGWGVLTRNFTHAKTKKKSLGILLSNEECAREVTTFAVHITKNHLCTKRVVNSTDPQCAGDSGGPIMFANRLQWHQEGIISHGSRECGSPLPDIQTRVVNYIDWIIEHLEP